VIGLASRAPVTLFDEPYLGLDAPSRQLFYDRFLADYAEHPRTVIVSTHLIDEVANLLERIVVVDHGKLVIDADAESLRGSASAIRGPAEQVARFVAGRRVVHTQRLGSLASATVLDPLDEVDHRMATDLHLDVSAMSLQQMVVLLTANGAAPDPSLSPSRQPAGEGAS
jgi:ABC-2 type transport system ATP-binding protein